MVFDEKDLAPYHGDQPFIFLSYSHKNAEEAKKIIRKMNSEGFRVWYDEGLIAGTEWSAEIAYNIERCSYLVALISKDYIASQNCKNELLYALDKKIRCLPVYLEETELPKGIALNLVSIRAVHKGNHPNSESFYKDMFIADGIEICRGEAENIDTNTNIELTPPINPFSGIIKIVVPIILLLIAGLALWKSGLFTPKTNDSEGSMISDNTMIKAGSVEDIPSLQMTNNSTEPEDNETVDIPETRSEDKLSISQMERTAKPIMADICKERDVEKATVYKVFSNEMITRDRIITITFQDNLKNMPDNAWDVSEVHNKNVMAWVEEDESGLYNLFIGAVGGIASPKDCTGLFNGYIHLEKIDFGRVFSTEDAVNMAFMFANCSSLIQLDISAFDTSKVENMTGMFYKCSSLSKLDISHFDTSNVSDMGAMFAYCSALDKLEVNNFDTSNVTDMGAMFHRCNHLKAIDVSNFNTAKVTDMSAMFYGCSGLKNLNVSSFDTSNVKNMNAMFGNCINLEKIDVSRFNTSNVTDMGAMFYKCNGLEELDVSSFDTSKVTSYDDFMPDSLNPNWRNIFVTA